MKVSTFASIKVFPIAEKVPFDPADHSTLALRLVEVGELHSGVGDEDSSEDFFNVLEVGSGSELGVAGGKPPGVCSSDIVTCSHPTVRVNFGPEYSNLFTELSQEDEMCNDRPCDKISFHLFESFSIDCRLTAAADGGDFESIVEEGFEVVIAAPVEAEDAEAIDGDAFEGILKYLYSFEEIRYNSSLLPSIHQNSPQAHREGGALEITGEGIGGGGLVVELREKGIKDLIGHGAVEAVVDVELLGLGEGCELFGSEEAGLDDLHSSRFSVVFARGRISFQEASFV